MTKPEDGAHLMAHDANDNLLYEGWAVRKGADTSLAIWKMKKYFWTAGTAGDQVFVEEAWADGNELYDNIWDNRATTVSYTQAV